MAKNWISVKTKTGKRKFIRKNRKRQAVKRRLYSNLQGVLIPDRTCVTLKYNEDLVLTVGAVGPTNYLFRCNSIFDPNYTGIGHQPMGHDQYQNFYKKYVVIGSILTATFKDTTNDNIANSNNSYLDVGVSVIQGTAGTIIDPREFKENNRTTYQTICTQRPYGRITKKFSAKRFFGLTNLLDNETYGADFGANPAEEAFFQLQMNKLNGSVSATVLVNVTMKYICVLRERVNLGLS